MAKNTSGVLITIRTFLPYGASIDDQYHTLGLLKDAQKNGVWKEVLEASSIDSVDIRPITRRVEEDAQADQ